jgi:integrating conjugative element relaxase (TIGR03760 family)
MATLSRFPRMRRWFGAAKRSSPPDPPAPTDPSPEDALPVRSPKELLFARRDKLNQLEELAGTTPLHFERYYLAALHRFAAFVQECPASESHHHAHLGGLLDHALEVAVTALRFRQGYLLPPGVPPEQAVHVRDRWTYAVFAAALVHDAGKPAVDQIITVFGADSRTWRWNPWDLALPDDPNARWYQVAFLKNRRYRLHEQAAPLLAPRLLGADGLAWLAEEPEAFAQWLAAAQGDFVQAGVLGEILSKADGRSVAVNLGAEPGPRAAAATVIPLHEKLITALRYLVEAGELPLNRNGAAGWRVDDVLWMVSKRTVDALRLHLTQTGHTGVPSHNDRLFDILQDHGFLLPSPSGRAVWRCEVRGETWAHELTLLKFPVARIWPDREGPAGFAGTVKPKTLSTPGVEAEPREPPTAAQPYEEPNLVDPIDSILAARAPISTAAESLAGPEPAQEPAPSAHAPADRGERFLAWVADGIAARRIDYNNPGARVHVVPEGVLLVSPGLFQDFVAHGNSALSGGEVLSWEKVQKRFLKLGIHRRTPTGLNVHRYAVIGDNRQTVINGVLLGDLARVFGPAKPSPNPHLRRVPS